MYLTNIKAKALWHPYNPFTSLPTADRQPSFLPTLLTLLYLLILLQSTSAQPTFSDNCLVFNDTSSTCLQCNDGYYLQYFFCIVCNPLCICTSKDNFCLSCLSIPHHNRTYSLGSYYDPQLHRCFLCHYHIPNCLLCNSPTLCTLCYHGHYPITITPPYTTPQITYCSLNECSPTTTNTTHCDICLNSTHCQLCYPGYYLNPIKYICYYSQCQPNCIICSDSSTCSNCTIGYFLNTNTCLPCIDNCDICTSYSDCPVCSPSYSYNSTSNQCYTTGLNNCVLYSGGYTTCNICYLGYFVLGGNCNQCVGCTICAIQFVCWSQCYSSALPFHYACLAYYSYSSRMSVAAILIVYIIWL